MHQSCLWQRPVTDEELAWFAVLGHALSDGVRFEADLGERSQPDVAVKQSVSEGPVHDLDEAVVPTEQERELRIVGR